MRAKLTEWLKRYLALEVVATVCSLTGGLGAASLTASGGVIAYAAAWAENAGFYGYALLREVRSKSGDTPLSFGAVTSVLLPSVRALIVEFGPAEVLDSFVLRPVCMYLLPQLTGHLVVGLVLGKVLADVAFFGLVVIAYEWSKSRT